jgi:hypothetical protein
MVASFSVPVGRLDDFLVLGEMPPGNDQAALVRWDFPQKPVIVCVGEQEVESSRKLNEQRVWASIRAWDL